MTDFVYEYQESIDYGIHKAVKNWGKGIHSESLKAKIKGIKVNLAPSSVLLS